MCREVSDADVRCRKLGRRLCDETLVVVDGTMSDDETADVKVEWGVLGCVLGSQGVQDELEVVLTVGSLLIEVEFQPEELGGTHGNLVLRQWNQVHLGRDAGRIEHTVTLLVIHHHVINDETVEEAHVHSSHAHFRSEFLSQGRGDLCSEEMLHR